MASVTKSPGSAISVSNSPYDDVEWYEPTRVYASDNNYAMFISISPGEYSEILKVTNFGFNIPSDVDIIGIKVEIEGKRYGFGAEPILIDRLVQLYKNNTLSGSNKAKNRQGWASEKYYEYGGGTDLWGSTWSYSDINSSGFGVGIAFQSDGEFTYAELHIDHVRITVYHTVNEVTIESPACEATIAGVVPAVKKRVTASTAGMMLSAGGHSIIHAVPSPSAGVDAAGVSPKLVSILYGVAGELSATPHVDVNLIWIARTAAASLEVSLPEPMIISGDWIIRPSPCVLVDALPAPSIREALSVASAGSVIDAWPPSVLFSAPAEACLASLDGLEPELMQVLRAPSLESTAEVKAPALLFLVPADVCGLTASFSVPLVGHRITVESAEMSGSFIPPGILEAVRAVTAGVVFYGIPFASTYDVLIRATAAGITCGADSPEVLCILWRRESTPESSSTWTRIEHDASIWSKDIAQAASAWTRIEHDAFIWSKDIAQAASAWTKVTK